MARGISSTTVGHAFSWCFPEIICLVKSFKLVPARVKENLSPQLEEISPEINLSGIAMTSK